jgi:hypothetical protein
LSVTAASGSVLTPFTSTSNRERTRVSRKKRPCAPSLMSPSPPLMAKVDSSTRVTTPAVESSRGTGPAKFHGSAMALPYRQCRSIAHPGLPLFL